MTFSRELVATITETTFKQCEFLAADLELFAKLEKLSLSLCIISAQYIITLSHIIIIIIQYRSLTTIIFPLGMLREPQYQRRM